MFFRWKANVHTVKVRQHGTALAVKLKSSSCPCRQCSFPSPEATTITDLLHMSILPEIFYACTHFCSEYVHTCTYAHIHVYYIHPSKQNPKHHVINPVSLLFSLTVVTVFHCMGGGGASFIQLVLMVHFV